MSRLVKFIAIALLIAVFFENYSTAWEQYQPQPYVKNYQTKHFSCLACQAEAPHLGVSQVTG